MRRAYKSGSRYGLIFIEVVFLGINTPLSYDTYDRGVFMDDRLTENDALKYEIAEELGLLDKVKKNGWKSLTARESGKIGGIMTKRKKNNGR